MKKVILIQPKIIQYSTKPFIPYSLLYLKAYISQRSDVVCEIVDYNIDNTIEKYLDDNEVLFFGITSLTGVQLRSAEMISRQIKKYSPKTPVVWGGVHATLAPLETIHEEYVDIVVVGEGEIPFCKLINAFLYNEHLDLIEGIYYKKNGKVFLNPKPSFVDLDALPPLPYETLDLSKYRTDVLWMITSRSCPNRCSFCVCAAMNEKWRGMSPEKMVDHVQIYLKVLNPSLVYLYDYNFFVRKDRIRRFAEHLIKRNINFKWVAQITAKDASTMDSQFIRLLKYSGCVNLVTGQDGARRLMKYVKKPSTYNQVFAAEERLFSEQLSLTCNFIIGLPNETIYDLHSVVDDIRATLDQFSGAVNIYVLTIWPGTALFGEMGEKEFEKPRSIREWSNIIPSDPDILKFHKRNYRNLLKTIYYTVRLNRSINILPLLPNDKNTSITSGYRAWENALLRLLSFIAKYRWKYNFFNFGIEWWFLHNIVKSRYRRFNSLQEKMKLDDPCQ